MSDAHLTVQRQQIVRLENCGCNNLKTPAPKTEGQQNKHTPKKEENISKKFRYINEKGRLLAVNETRTRV